MVLLAAVPCVSSEGEVQPHETGQLIQGLQCASDPTQTYSLFLPSKYDPSRSWPVLLVFDPRGRSVVAAELFLGAAEELGWIVVSSNDTRSDTAMEPNRRAVNALWPEIHSRYPINAERVYAAGFSGTAFLALRLGAETGGLAGAILAGGRYIEEEVAGVTFPVFGTVGTLDFNNRACALALAGSRSAALDALEAAVERGFNDLELMSGDSDLDSIRGTDRYRELVKQLRGAGREPR